MSKLLVFASAVLGSKSPGGHLRCARRDARARTGVVVAGTFVRYLTMRVRITRAWQISFPLRIQLEAGQVFDIRPSLAIYLLAMHCAEPVKDSGGGDDPRSAWREVGRPT